MISGNDKTELDLLFLNHEDCYQEKLHLAVTFSATKKSRNMRSPMNLPRRALTQLSNQAQFQFVKKREICKLTGLSGDTLKKYRLSGLLIEDIHWIRVNSKVVLYNVPLVMDWLHNISDPNAHLRAIGIYQSMLLSNRKLQRKSS